MRSTHGLGVPAVCVVFLLGGLSLAQANAQNPDRSPNSSIDSSVAQKPTAGKPSSDPSVSPSGANMPQHTPDNGAPEGTQAGQTPESGQAPDQAPTGEQPAPQEPTTSDSGMFVFKKNVEEVVLHATVVDAQRHLVTGLKKEDFSVSENGVTQSVTSFRSEDIPVEIGIVVDNSGSMRDKREEVSQSVLNLIRASNPDDQVFVVNFGRSPYLDQDFTSNVTLLQAALHQTSAKGDTALYDAVAASTIHLEHNPKLSKKVLLVITDGEDNMSQETLQENLRSLQKPDGPTVYAIGLVGSGLRSEGRNALQQLAEGTGGVAYFPDSLDQVNEITRSVARDIRNQYIIAFRPKNQNVKPQYQSLKVEALAPGYTGLTVRTRSGYYPSANAGPAPR